MSCKLKSISLNVAVKDSLCVRRKRDSSVCIAMSFSAIEVEFCTRGAPVSDAGSST